MLLTDEIGGQTYPLGEMRLDKPFITVRELIAARVNLELEAHNAVNVSPSDAPNISSRELLLNGADKALRSSLFRACFNGETWARDQMIEAAVKGFLRNRFFILSDRRQVEHLDERLDLDTTGEVTFLQLTQLQGG